MAGKNPKNTDEQTRRFEQAAHDFECDDDPAHFDEVLKKVARHKPAESDSASPPKPEKPSKPE